MVELLKQDQYQPMAIEDEVMVIFAGTQGYLDDLPVEAVRPFEREFLEFMRERYPEVGRTIRETGDLPEETEKLLRKAIEEFKGEFKRRHGLEGKEGGEG